MYPYKGSLSYVVFIVIEHGVKGRAAFPIAELFISCLNLLPCLFMLISAAGPAI